MVFFGSFKATFYVVQWGGPHVWKVGGMFAIDGWKKDEKPAFTFKNQSQISFFSVMNLVISPLHI